MELRELPDVMEIKKRGISLIGIRHLWIKASTALWKFLMIRTKRPVFIDGV